MQIRATKFVSLHAAHRAASVRDWRSKNFGNFCSCTLMKFCLTKIIPAFGLWHHAALHGLKVLLLLYALSNYQLLLLCRFIVATQNEAGWYKLSINQPNVSKVWHFRKYKCVQFGKIRFFFRPKSSYSSLSLFHSLLSQTGKRGHRSKMTHFASGTAYVFALNISQMRLWC